MERGRISRRRERGSAPLPGPDLERGKAGKTEAVDIRAFKTELLEGRVHAPENLAMRSAFSEARVMTDPALQREIG